MRTSSVMDGNIEGMERGTERELNWLKRGQYVFSQSKSHSHSVFVMLGPSKPPVFQGRWGVFLVGQ